MRLSKLVEKAGLASECNFSDTEITDIVTNSREATYGCMFVCLSGRSEDGHRHIVEALLKGASAVVIEFGVPNDLPDTHQSVNIIVCDNTRLAAARLYSAWYGDPAQKLKMIAVTGTNGKTSVTFMLKAIFEAALFKCGIIGTVACYSGHKRIFAAPDDPLANMTTPDPRQLYRMLAYMVADNVDYVFIEASSHALKLFKLDAIEFECGIFTNLTVDHLDFHKTMDDYYLSKARLFSLCKKALINADDAFFERLRSDIIDKCEISTYSVKENRSDFEAQNIINFGTEGINYVLKSQNTVMRVTSPIPGMFTVANTLCASACAILCGIPPSVIQSALRSLLGIDGRMERVKLCHGTDFSMFIDYAHTPDALEGVLKTVRGFRRDNERIVLVFGCGGDRDHSKRPIMGRIASEMADFSIITADNSRNEETSDIISEIMSGFDKRAEYVIIEDRRAAIEYAIQNAKSGDVIILAGKGHEKYEIDKNGRHEFDERKIAVELAEKYYLK